MAMMMMMIIMIIIMIYCDTIFVLKSALCRTYIHLVTKVILLGRKYKVK